jgi:hypothetical protein
LERVSLVRDKFALLAKVGVQKRRASRFQDETEFYYTTATELLAISGDLLDLLQRLEPEHPELKGLLSDHTSRYHRSIRRLLGFWGKDIESQERSLKLLDSDGLARVLADTPDGYVSLSSDLILRNVERAIEATCQQ